MKSKMWKWALLGAAFTFIVLYGVEMSTAGIERIQGPFTSVPIVQQENGGNVLSSKNSNVEQKSNVLPQDEEYWQPRTVAERKLAKLEKELEELRKLALKEQRDEEFWRSLPDADYEGSPVNKFADSASGVLQTASSSGIKFVVSMFEGLFK